VYDVPSAQPAQAICSAMTPPMKARPLPPLATSSGRTSTTMPRHPTARPATAPRVTPSPRGNTASKPTDQKGTVAMITAARPLATYCSAQTTKPLPTTFISTPRRTSDPHNRGGGSRRPAASTTAESSTPAAIHRNPATNSTGTVSSATRIAR
jgi:hypothetical protein